MVKRLNEELKPFNWGPSCVDSLNRFSTQPVRALANYERRLIHVHEILDFDESNKN